MSFDDCAIAYVAAHRAGWRNAKHASQWTNTIATYCSPVFGKLPVQAIGRRHGDTGAAAALDHEIRDGAPGARPRRGVLDWAKVRGYRDGDNPARWKGHLDHLLPARGKVHKVRHHSALPYAEIADFMRDLRERKAVAARALEFAILTATRTSETLNAAWSEFDLANRLWTIPEPA